MGGVGKIMGEVGAIMAEEVGEVLRNDGRSRGSHEKLCDGK